MVENKTEELKNEKAEENKTDYHKVFGMLLVYLRKNNYDLEYSILSNVDDLRLKEDNIVLGISDSFGYNKIQQNIDVVKNFVKEYSYGIGVENTIAKEKINIIDLLKEKFGNYLKIIK